MKNGIDFVQRPILRLAMRTKMFLLSFLPTFAFSGWIFGQTSSEASPPSMPVATAEQALATGAATQDDKIPLGDVIKQVQDAVQEYQESLGGRKDALPPLGEVELDFKVTTATNQTGGIDVYIFSFGVSHGDEVVNDVTYTYSLPPPPKGLRKPPELKDDLVKTIQSAAQAVKTATTLGKLKFGKLTVNIQYGVKWGTKVGAHFPIKFVTIGLSADKNRNTVQSVKLTFKELKP